MRLIFFDFAGSCSWYSAWHSAL